MLVRHVARCLVAKGDSRWRIGVDAPRGEAPYDVGDVTGLRAVQPHFTQASALLWLLPRCEASVSGGSESSQRGLYLVSLRATR